jgi:hypothetical protein
MPFQAIASAAGLAISGIGAVRSQRAQKRQQQARERAIKVQEQQANLRQNRERRRLIAEARAKRATALQSATNQGAAEGSGIAGGLGSIQSQLSSSLSFLSTNRALDTQQNIFARQEVSAASDKATGQAIFGLGKTIFSEAGGFGAFKNIFDKDK